MDQGGEEWLRWREGVLNRVNTTNVVGSLIIASAAVFLTTTTPDDDPTLANWGSRTSFMAFGLTIFLSILSVLTGCLICYIFTDLRAEDLRVPEGPNTAASQRMELNLIGIIFFLLLHTIFLDVALLSILIAIFGAVWSGSSGLAKAGAIFTAVVTFLLYAYFAALVTSLFRQGSGEDKELRYWPYRRVADGPATV